METRQFLEQIMWVLGLVFGEYLLVLFAVLADLVSGVRKALKRGEARRSAAFRRTVDKISRYYNALFALTVIDLMQMSAISYLRVVEDWNSIPIFPLFTLLGSLGVALIEVKSIYEKAEEKERRDYCDAASLLRSLLASNEIKEYLLKSKNENV